MQNKIKTCKTKLNKNDMYKNMSFLPTKINNPQVYSIFQ